MKLYSSSLIGHNPSRRSEFFSATDTKESFIKTLKTFPDDWEYRKEAVSYHRNSNGHRSKEIKDIDFANYILCIGCSYTEGIGVPVSSRYSEILASMLKTDVYNLGLAGTGNDVIVYNLTTWLSVINNSPKLIIIQWTSSERSLLLHNDQEHFVTIGPWSTDETEFIVNGDKNMFFKTRTFLFKKMIRNLSKVPVIEIPWKSYDNFPESSSHEINLVKLDSARDLQHPGIKSNEDLARRVFNHTQKLSLL